MKIFLRYGVVITSMIFCLSAPTEARTTEKIVGSVIAGETGYEIPVEVVNNNEDSISEVSAKVQSTPRGLINFKVTPKRFTRFVFL